MQICKLCDISMYFGIIYCDVSICTVWSRFSLYLFREKQKSNLGFKNQFLCIEATRYIRYHTLKFLCNKTMYFEYLSNHNILRQIIILYFQNLIYYDIILSNYKHTTLKTNFLRRRIIKFKRFWIWLSIITLYLRFFKL